MRASCGTILASMPLSPSHFTSWSRSDSVSCMWWPVPGGPAGCRKDGPGHRMPPSQTMDQATVARRFGCEDTIVGTSYFSTLFAVGARSFVCPQVTGYTSTLSLDAQPVADVEPRRMTTLPAVFFVSVL